MDTAEAPEMYSTFIAGLQHGMGLPQEGIPAAIGSDLEQHLWLLWLCYAYLNFRKDLENVDSGAQHVVSRWMKNLEAEYGDPFAEAGTAMEATETQQSETVEPEAQPFLTIVRSAASALPDSLWNADAWRSDFILDWGLRIARSEGMMMRTSEESVNYVLYLDPSE